MKKCSSCGVVKELNEFFNLKKAKVGKTSQCKECNAAYKREHKLAVYAKNRDWRVRNPIQYMLGRAKKRAADKGIPFDVSVEDIEKPTHCPMLGVELIYGGDKLPNKQAHPNAASLDRIRPELGYVKGNVVIVSWRANNIKSDATAEELLAIGKWLRKHK